MLIEYNNIKEDVNTYVNTKKKRLNKTKQMFI